MARHSPTNITVLDAALFTLLLFARLIPSGTHALATAPSKLLPAAPIPVTEVHRLYAGLSEGKHLGERVNVHVVVQEVKPVSARLTFLRVRDVNVASSAVGSGEIELLLRERDSFLSQMEIANITNALAIQPGATLQCRAFPERLSIFDGPSFFPHLHPPPVEPVCLHVVAANISLVTGELLELCPTERRRPRQDTDSTTLLSGQMPPLVTGGRKRNRSRGGGNNRDRGGIFSAWALETFGPALLRNGILDVAGGSGQLAFQLGVRRGFNTTVVDPRALRLASDQRNTLQWQRQTGLRLLPDDAGRDLSLSPSDYGYHFCQVRPLLEYDVNGSTAAVTHEPQTRDQTWLVGGEAYVRHQQKWFNAEFASSSSVWRDCSVVFGMHPDEATEDIIDLALAHNKPFAVVPCCVFWKRDPHRRTSDGRPVRTWEQFCEYLAAKDDRIQTEILPFPGRNVVLYCLGSTT